MKIYPKVKRILDFCFSLILLLLLWPLFLVIMIVIKIDSKGPVYFKQKRIGKSKKEFCIIKFRTMRMDTPKDIPTHLLNEPEIFITRLGKVLRKTSLDELPQLVNILKGEMSFIGPRPAVWSFFDLIEGRDKYGANEILPGLTGWAQINGRDVLPTHIKAHYDGYYTQNISFLLDLKIFLKTIPIVLFSKGVIEGNKPSKEFTKWENVMKL
ncbi:sugar transferase [Tepidibacillus marianensis]|uniref:sugar transferase n=1 Tax=Tepidibacillus marianensis TaxID=3131995 RepID=UPI0030CB3DEA